jgi:NitT/TauT family transport system permease protein
MFIVILLYDQLLFRPLVAWAEKFKSEQVTDGEEIRSWVIHLLHRTRFLRYFGLKMRYLFDAFVNIKFLRAKSEKISAQSTQSYSFISILNILFWVLIIGILLLACYFLYQNVPLHAILHVFILGLITALRVFILVFLCSLIWVPIGVWVGLRPSAAYFVQPIAQFLAAFPANLLYPFVVILIVTYHLNVNIWATPLMILGAQWYVLFNVVAGASVIPKDLLQVADNLGLNTWLRWRRLILPSIFPYYITGAITAAGGAWNASIVAEVVSWGNTKLVSTGLGAFISEVTTKGDFINTALGIGMMCILVLIFNRLIWRPLYVFSEKRFIQD